MAKNTLENHVIVKFARLLFDLIEKGKIDGFQSSDIVFLRYTLRNKITEYGIVKLLDDLFIKNKDILDKYDIPYKSLDDINCEKVKDKVVYDKIYVKVNLTNNIFEVKLPWLTREKFNVVLKFLKEDLDMEFEYRNNSDPIWFTIVRDKTLFDDFFNNEIIKEIGVEYDSDNIEKAKQKIKDDLQNQKKLFNLSTTASLDETEQFKGLFKKLYPFQQVAVEYSKHRNNILIADEMGLGKSVQAIAIMEYHQLYPVIIVAPASLRGNWSREIKKWLDDKSVSVIESGDTIHPGDIYIVSYSMVKKMANRLMIRKPKLIVCDESHYMKSPNANRTQAILKSFKDIPYKVLTTGTPILNRTVELLPQLDFLGVLDSHFGGKRKFTKRYAPPSFNGWGTVYGSANEEELQVELRKSCMIRRLKKDVLTEMPDKVRQVVPLPLENRKSYEMVERDSINWYEQQLKKKNLSEEEIEEKLTEKLSKRSEYAEKMVKVEYLRQAAVEYKMKYVFEWIDSALEQVDKLIIFAHHRDIIEKLNNRYKNNSVMLYGGMSGQVTDIVNKFINDDKINLFIGSLQSSGIGIDGLQNVCNQVAFVELAWTPAMMMQAEDRAHRIGQTDTVNIYYLIGENSIEEYIYKKVIEKEELFEKTTNINELFKWIKNKYR